MKLFAKKKLKEKIEKLNNIQTLHKKLKNPDKSHNFTTCAIILHYSYRTTPGVCAVQLCVRRLQLSSVTKALRPITAVSV